MSGDEGGDLFEVDDPEPIVIEEDGELTYPKDYVHPISAKDSDLIDAMVKEAEKKLARKGALSKFARKEDK